MVDKIISKEGVVSEGQVIKKEEKADILLHGCSSICGEKTAYEFHRVYDEEAKREIVVRGEPFDLDEFIQNSSSSTDFAMLREQYAKTGILPGDTDKQYGVDELLFPDDIHQLNHIMRTGKETFDKLPDNVKAAFGNNYQAYLSSCMRGDQNSVIANFYDKLAKDAVAAANKQQEGGASDGK